MITLPFQLYLVDVFLGCDTLLASEDFALPPIGIVVLGNWQGGRIPFSGQVGHCLSHSHGAKIVSLATLKTSYHVMNY
jgi:hypothetical protein